MSTDYRVALDPGLGIQAADFVAAWSDAPECLSVAAACSVDSADRRYDPGLVAEALLTGVAGGITANTLYDLIRQTLSRRGYRKRTRIERRDGPDGHLLVVTIDEERRP